MLPQIVGAPTGSTYRRESGSSDGPTCFASQSFRFPQPRHAATICSRAFAVCNQAGCPKFRYSVMLLCFNRSARGWSFGYGGGARFNAGSPCPSPPSSSSQRCRPRPWGHQEVRKSTNTITGGGQPDPVRRVDRKHDLGDMTCVGFRVVDTGPVGAALGAEAVIGEPEPTVRDAVDGTARPRVRKRAGAGHAGMLDPAEAAAVVADADRAVRSERGAVRPAGDVGHRFAGHQPPFRSGPRGLVTRSPARSA